MERFAKLFEAHGRQLLVKKSYDEDDRPKLSLIIQSEDAELDLGFSFPDTQAGETNRDKLFEDYDQAKAETYLKIIENCADSFEIICAMNEARSNG